MVFIFENKTNTNKQLVHIVIIGLYGCASVGTASSLFSENTTLQYD